MIRLPVSKFYLLLALLFCASPLPPPASGAGPAATPSATIQALALTFDEAGRTFSKVAGQQVSFSGSCRWENVQIVLSGAVNSRAVARKGRWETAPMPLENFTMGPVEITATVMASNGTPAATAKLKFNVVNLLNEGAVGDGKTDDLAAIKAALKKAHALENGIVYAPGDHIYAHSDLIEVDGLELLGGGEQTVFLATDPLKSAIVLKGDTARLRNVAVESRLGDTKRQSTPQTTAVWVNHGTNFLIDHVTVKNAASAGIFNFGGSGSSEAPARITNNTVFGTLADGIHNTNGAHDVRIEGNTCRQTGDDMIAVVSYDNNPEICRDIVIAHNTVADNNWARGISVVGGKGVSIIENSIASTKAAGIYICSEDSYHTYGVDDVTVRGNKISKCATGTPAHAAIFLSGRDTLPVSDVKIEGNMIEDSPAAAIKLLRNVRETTINENQIRGAPKDGISVKAATDTLITKNHIENTGGIGIHVEKDAQGFCNIIENDLVATNTSGQLHVAAISFDLGTALTSVEVRGNKNHPSRYRVEKIVECKIPNALVKNNN